MREIGEKVGLTSSSCVAHQLRMLEEKGFIKRDPNRPRALEVFIPELMAARRAIASPTRPATTDRPATPCPGVVPMVGRIAAGGPILAEERVEEIFPLPKALVGDGTLFLLEVVGDSMVDAAICSGDYVVVRQQPDAENGEIVAAMHRRRGDREDASSARTARSGCSPTTTPTSPSTAPTPRSSARSRRFCAESEGPSRSLGPVRKAPSAPASTEPSA